MDPALQNAVVAAEGLPPPPGAALDLAAVAPGDDAEDGGFDTAAWWREKQAAALLARATRASAALSRRGALPAPRGIDGASSASVQFLPLAPHADLSASPLLCVSRTWDRPAAVISSGPSV